MSLATRLAKWEPWPTILVFIAWALSIVVAGGYFAANQKKVCDAACGPRPGIRVRIDHEDPTCMCRWDDGSFRPPSPPNTSTPGSDKG